MDVPSTNPKPFKWGFFSAALMILALAVIGQFIGNRIEDLPASGMRAKDWILGAFLLSSAVFLILQRAAVKRFFRTMQVGVTLVALSALSVFTGVLIPQIEGFEDPTERVTANNYEDQFKQFKWAEAFFFYHLVHPYGIGMPATVLPPGAEEGLVRFGNKYGIEERDNHKKQMTAMFSGDAKSREIEGFLKNHDGAMRTFFDVATALSLNRTYKSHWFASLLTLLFTGVFFNTFKNRPSAWFTPKKVGWFTVHIGVMTLLIGGAISKRFSDRGIVHMDLREPPKDEYWAYMSRDKLTRMPFALKLDRFARRDWKTLQVWFRDENFRSNPPDYTLWPGREIDLDYQPDETGVMRPGLHLKVLELAERAEVKPPRFWEAPDRADHKGLGALAEFMATEPLEANDPTADDNPGRERPILMKPEAPYDTYYDRAWKFRLRLMYGDDATAARDELVSSDVDRIGFLDIAVRSQGEIEPTRVPIALGRHVQAPGGYDIEVQEAMADFRLDPRGPREIRDPRPLADQFPRNPGVWLSITKNGGEPERRLVLEGLDAEQHKDLQAKCPNPGLVLKLEWDRWGSKGPPRYVLNWGPAAAPALFTEDSAPITVELDQPLALPGKTRLVPHQLIHNALFEKDIEFKAKHIQGPQFDEDFYATEPTGLSIEVTTAPGTPREKKEVVKMASTEQFLSDGWNSGDERFFLRYYENDRAFPFEWRSVLSVYQKDAEGQLYKVDLGPESEREIRVNDYFYYRGYRFFQTNAEARLPTYSGIGVVYDPGIPVVLYGMYTIILGTLLAFIVRPIAEAYGKYNKGRTT